MDAHTKMLLNLSQGNPGALTFLMGLMESENIAFSLDVMAKIGTCQIKGTDLYVLWSDLCGKDYGKVHMLCIACPDEVLKDACSRQDYSGRELVTKYL
jgi:hypothetical protein